MPLGSLRDHLETDPFAFYLIAFLKNHNLRVRSQITLDKETNPKA